MNFYIIVLTYGLEISRTVLAEGADYIIGKGVALMYISAYLAYESLLALRFGLGLDVVLIVCVGYTFLIGNNSCFRYGADKHSVGVKVDILLYLKGHEGIYISGKEYKTVV